MKRISIRILVSLIACAALAAFAWIPIPEDTNGHPVLPAVALEQAGLYRLEVALMVFYGGLLLITPAFSGLIEGRLPIEISARGARFADSTDEALDDLEKTAADLEGELSLLAAD
ncbi:MAG TPA: hypothetical protein VGK66_02750, partial [Solirubrobacterales bacterium]